RRHTRSDRDWSSDVCSSDLGTVVVVPPSDFRYRGIVYSRDANYLYFTTGERNEDGVLYQVALPGSTPRKIKDRVDSPIAFSPTRSEERRVGKQCRCRDSS